MCLITMLNFLGRQHLAVGKGQGVKGRSEREFGVLRLLFKYYYQRHKKEQNAELLHLSAEKGAAGLFKRRNVFKSFSILSN